MPYMVTFTINIPPMLVYIPYMDPMGNKHVSSQFACEQSCHRYMRWYMMICLRGFTLAIPCCKVVSLSWCVLDFQTPAYTVYTGPHIHNPYAMIPRCSVPHDRRCSFRWRHWGWPACCDNEKRPGVEDTVTPHLWHSPQSESKWINDYNL